MSVSGIRATVRTSSVQALRQVFIVSLVVGSVLIGLLALHSMAGSHGGVPAAALGSAEQTHSGNEILVGAGVPVAASFQQEKVTLPLLLCDQGCQAGCALIAVTCLLLVILVAMVFLARYPALFHRLIDRGRRIIQRIPEARNHIYLPSLTVLSISRT